MNFSVEQSCPDPSYDCSLCPRLHEFLNEWRQIEPNWYNGPVKPFWPKGGGENTKLLIVGLAPGLRGANRTGRPFTGDYAGDLLYSTLKMYGFAQGQFEARIDDSLQLVDCAIANAVRCVPPQNKPVGAEINMCRQFLSPLFNNLPNLKIIVPLGAIAHQSTIRALKKPVSHYPFKHGLMSDVDGLKVLSSYHCSRYNTNTGVLTDAMFHDIFEKARAYLDTQ